MELEPSLLEKDRGRVFADGYRGRISDAIIMKTSKQAFIYTLSPRPWLGQLL